MTEYLETYPDVPMWKIVAIKNDAYLDAEGIIIDVHDPYYASAPGPINWRRFRTIAIAPRALHLLRAFLADGMSGQLRSEMRKLVAFVDGEGQ